MIAQRTDAPADPYPYAVGSSGPAGFDPGRYKLDQRRGWGRAAAGWTRWWERFERAAGDVSDRLVELARIRPGQTVLDVATGIGEPAVTAARRMGSSGRVVAVDQAPQMLSEARRRMASLGLTNLEFVETDAELLDFPDETFDAVLSRWGLMFLPDLDRLLCRLLRLLVPGGRLAAAVWGDAARVPLIGLAGEVLRRELRISPPSGMPTPFDLADPVAFERRLAGAGFTDVTIERLTVTFEFASPEEYARFVAEVGAHPPALDELSPAREGEVWHAVASAAARLASPNGSLTLANECLIASAGRPHPPSEDDRDPPPAERPGKGDQAAAAVRREAVKCPFCGGGDTRLEAPFGSTLGLAQYWCRTCRTVFEFLKWEGEGA